MLGAAVVAVLCSVAAWRSFARVQQTSQLAKVSLAGQLEDVDDDAQRMVVANEVLADLDHALNPDLRLPTKLAWIALVGCVALAIAARLQGSWWGLGGCLLAGVLGPMSCLWAGRATSAAAERARRRVDDDVAEVMGDLYDVAIVLPKRREMRWKRRRSG